MTNKLENEIEVVNFRKFSQEELSQDIRILHRNGNSLTVLYKNKNYEVVIKSEDTNNKTYLINVGGFDYTIKINEPLDQTIQKLGFLKPVVHSLKILKAPMPGLVVEISVQVGDEISLGQNLLSLEAMKMENIIKSQGVGKIKTILVQKGMAVDKNQTLIEFE